jgi:hypothetical protein
MVAGAVTKAEASYVEIRRRILEASREGVALLEVGTPSFTRRYRVSERDSL